MEKPLDERQQQSARPAFNEKQYVIFMHLSQLLMFVGVPNFVAPLIMWLVKKDQSKAVDDHGKEILNFSITMFLLVVLSIAFFLTIVGIVLAVPLLIFVLFVSVVLPIVAAVKVSNGKTHVRYPFTYRFLR
jgi:uncharacterized Tic20 family protein